MKPEGWPPRARQYIENLAAAGRYHFGSTEAKVALEVSSAAAKVALNRLAKKGAIASPARGFYVIIPPEYRLLGCLPADQFIPSLMKSLNLTYMRAFSLPRNTTVRHISARRNFRFS